MKQKVPVKKLFRIAIYTSTAIGLITLAPVYITVFTVIEAISPETISSIMEISVLPPSILIIIVTAVISLLTFTFWTINILLTCLLDKYTISLSVKAKYFFSYILCILIIIIFRSSFQLGYFEPRILSILNTYNTNNTELLRFVLFILFALSTNTIILIIQDLMLLREKKAIIELEHAQLKLKNIEATYNQLKQQVNPHFLFNSLNTLKTLINENPDAGIFLKRLADFLRISISLNNENVIELKEELKICMDYLELQKARFGKALQFTVNIPDEVKSGLVPVFALQQLIENAIKHNALTNNNPLHIKIEYTHNRIIVSNNIRIKNTTEESTGVGLINLAERYKILSGNEIFIKNDDNQFSVSLKVLSYEDCNYRG